MTKNPAITRAIAFIPDTAWTPVRYPGAVRDPDTAARISDAEVAEVPYTAFAHTTDRTSARLVVRRVNDARRRGIRADEGDAPSVAHWRNRLFIATSHLTAAAAGYLGRASRATHTSRRFTRGAPSGPQSLRHRLRHTRGDWDSGGRSASAVHPVVDRLPPPVTPFHLCVKPLRTSWRETCHHRMQTIADAYAAQPHVCSCVFTTGAG
jgi:hypothetical protein